MSPHWMFEPCELLMETMQLVDNLILNLSFYVIKTSEWQIFRLLHALKMKSKPSMRTTEAHALVIDENSSELPYFSILHAL